MPRHYLLALAALLLPLAGFAGDPPVRRGVLHLSFDAAVRMALEKNYTIQVEQFAPQIARENVTSALGEFDPVLKLGGGREQISTRDDFLTGQHLAIRDIGQTDTFNASLSGLTPLGTRYDLGFDTRNATGTARDFGGNFRTGTGISLTQPLLRGFGTAATLQRVRIARLNVESSEWALRNQVIDTLTTLAYVYNDLYTAGENLDVAERSRELARHLMEDNTRRAAIGVMTPLDITTARAEVASREESVILAKRNVLDNENLLKQLVTNHLERMLSIRVEIERPPAKFVHAEVTSGIRSALELRPDYRQSILDLQERHIRVAFAKNQTLPQLDLTTSLNLLGLENDFGSSVDRLTRRDQTGWSVGAAFSIPLGNRTARGNLNAAKLAAAQGLVQLQQLEQQIVVDVDNAAGQIVTDRARIESTTEARKLAEESLQAGEERLRAGTGTTFEVLELQKKLADAELAELRARSDYNKAVAEYFRKTGTTLEVHRVELR